MSETRSKAWFGPRRLGWGASPRRWEGWAVTLAFVALMIGANELATPWVSGFSEVSAVAARLGIALVCLAPLFVIIRLTYDKDA